MSASGAMPAAYTCPLFSIAHASPRGRHSGRASPLRARAGVQYSPRVVFHDQGLPTTWSEPYAGLRQTICEHRENDHDSRRLCSFSVRCSLHRQRARGQSQSLRRGCKAKGRQRRFRLVAQGVQSVDLSKFLSSHPAPLPTSPRPSGYR